MKLITIVFIEIWIKMIMKLIWIYYLGATKHFYKKYQMMRILVKVKMNRKYGFYWK